MKKVIITISVLTVLAVALFAAGTLAYFTDGEDDRLLITMDGSNLSGEIIEKTVPAGGGEAIIGPSPVRIVPGSTVSKSISIKNTGSMAMYVRLSLDKNFILSKANEGKPTNPDLVEFTLNTEFWELRDGFYYYKDAIFKNETTEPLFTEVRFSNQMDNVYTNSTITFEIKAYATQIPSYAESVFDVQTWPDVEEREVNDAE